MLQDEINALNVDFCKAAGNQDLDEVVGFYEPDARMLPPNAPIAIGRDGIRQTLQAFIDAGMTSLDLQSLHVLHDGSLVIDVGRYVLGIQPPGGDPFQDTGKYTVVLRRQTDGSLKIAVDMFNSDLPLG